MQLPYLETNAITTHFEEIGEGPCVVFCHGLAGHCERELPWARELATRGYRVVVYSARGHARSTPITDPGAYTFDSMVRDLRCLMDALEIEQAVVGGGSMGAAITLAFTLKHPERVNALLQFGPAFGDQSIELVAAGFSIFGDLIGSIGVSNAIDQLIDRVPMIQEMAQADPQLIEDLRDQWNAHVPASIVAAMKGVPASRPFGSLDDLGQIKVPTLVVAAPGDPIHPIAVAEEYARRIENAELKVVPLSPPLYRSPETMASVVGEFCDSLG